jgi:acyl carrier protein
MGNNREKLIEILVGVKPGIDFEAQTKLVEQGVLDSFDIISLVVDLNEIFDVDIPVEEIAPENFDSVDAILSLIESLSDD